MSGFVGPIKEIARGIYDGPHATPPEASSGPVFLGIGNVTAHGRLDLSKIRHLSEHDYSRWTRRVTPQADDIVFSYEATLHRYAVIPEGFRGCLGRRMALIRPDTTKVVPRFLHYYFLCDHWRSVVESNVISGATVDRIPLTRIPDFQVRIPDMATQCRIAYILSAYDDLIENNRRRIQLLELSARLLYKEWFVHLRFPGHEHVKIKDGVPTGWRCKKIADVCQTIGGGTPSTKVSEYWDGDIIWVVPTDVTRNDCLVLLDSERKITEEGLSQSSAQLVPEGTILMTSRASVGFFALMDVEVCTNQGFINIIPHDKEMRRYLLFNLISRTAEIRSNAKGTTYPEMSKGRFRQMDIITPPKPLVTEFGRLVGEVLQQMRLLKQEAFGLVKARELILPRMMRGEMRCPPC